jgi:preprotein translocase subunit SecD
MSLYGTIRENWRVGLLVVLVALSTVFLFAPGFAPAGATGESPTNLKYGLQLDGGTQIRAPLVGVTAQEVNFGGDDPNTVANNVAAELDAADPGDVIARFQSQEGGTVEVTVENVDQSELESALDAAGYEYETVRDGVTSETREQTVKVLQSKINEAGLSGGRVQTVDTPGARPFVVVEVPGGDRSEVIDLVNSKGAVKITAYYPTQENGSREYVNETLFTDDELQRIGNPREGQGQDPPFVQVRIKSESAQAVQAKFVETGVAKSRDTICNFPETEDPCLLIVRDGKVVNSFGMDGRLGTSMVNGQWQKDPGFILQVNQFSEAQQVSVDLRAGSLPAPLDVDSGTASTISPVQGEDFKRNSLIAGILAVFAVSGVVFLRYGEAEVALPMIVTALAEVYALMGIAALIQFPVDLAVIGGFIAVIGTGVDDLIIIANEVMDEGEVNSRRVFQSRFRKAFWVIGAAAATTVIAMSPLAVLSLGDLQGFAIFTILGVLIGVLITRPAYGDILRSLLTDK